MISFNPIIASSTYSPNLAQRQEIKNLTETVDARIDGQMDLAQQYFLYFEKLNNPRELKKYSPYEQYLITQITTHLLGTYIKPLPRHDLDTDHSPTKYVSGNRPYDNIYYEPKELILVQNVADIYVLGEDDLYVHIDIYNDLKKLANDFRNELGYKLTLTSGYRSHDEQKHDFSLECKQNKKCAYEGTSEHQSGLAIDVGGMKGLAYERMASNAHIYGFHQSYQKGIEVDGYQREDRHWRWLGSDLATELYQKGLTFTQWVREEERE